MLSQIQNGEEKVIAYASKTLCPSRQRYCVTYRELYAVVTFVKQFRHYLLGRKFLVRTDHSSLKWLKNFKDPEGMVARWIATLGTFDFDLEYRKGTQHSNCDALSRRPYRSCKRDNCADCRQFVLKPETVRVVTRSQGKRGVRVKTPLDCPVHANDDDMSRDREEKEVTEISQNRQTGARDEGNFETAPMATENVAENRETAVEHPPPPACKPPPRLRSPVITRSQTGRRR